MAFGDQTCALVTQIEMLTVFPYPLSIYLKLGIMNLQDVVKCSTDNGNLLQSK